MPLHDAQFTGEGWFAPYTPGMTNGWFDAELLEITTSADTSRLRMLMGYGLSWLLWLATWPWPQA